MEKRLLLAIGLSLFIIITFQYFAPKPVRRPGEPVGVNMPMAAKPFQELEEAATIETKPSIDEKLLEAKTDKYIVTFSNVGGAIKEIRLKDHKAASGEPLDVVKIDNPKEYLLNISSLSSAMPLDISSYEISRQKDTITCFIKTENLEIVKKYTLHNSKYIIELQLYVKNISNTPKEFDYRIIGGSGLTEANEKDKSFIEVTSKVNGKILGFKRPKNGERIINPGVASWSAVKNKYFSLILKPLATTKAQFYSSSKNGYFVMGTETAPITVQPGMSVENKFILFAGPSQASLLKTTGYDFEETINYGFFGGISKILISVMVMFYRVVHSWGVSIILLSVFLNIILFPLTMKGFKSMQKMQELHPQMEKLKIQHKDNPQKLNKEVMELYKKYNINPLSGCLPMLLQMPIFIALYQALMRSIELRSSSFLWIKDLSMPDAVKIPITLPIFGNSINILPLVMVVGMVLQQKISTKTMGSAVTEEQKQQQKMMLIIMPIVFGFVFYNMPSGLVLYWVVNTALTIIEQASILKKD